MSHACVHQRRCHQWMFNGLEEGRGIRQWGVWHGIATASLPSVFVDRTSNARAMSVRAPRARLLHAGRRCPCMWQRSRRPCWRFASMFASHSPPAVCVDCGGGLRGVRALVASSYRQTKSLVAL